MLLRLSQHNPVRGWVQRFTAENTERQAVPFKAPRAAKTIQPAADAERYSSKLRRFYGLPGGDTGPLLYTTGDAARTSAETPSA